MKVPALSVCAAFQDTSSVSMYAWKSSALAVPPLLLITVLASFKVGAISSFVIVQVFSSPDTTSTEPNSLQSPEKPTWRYPDGSVSSPTSYVPAISLYTVPVSLPGAGLSDTFTPLLFFTYKVKSLASAPPPLSLMTSLITRRVPNGS